MRWMLTSYGQFTSAFLYRHWSFVGVRDMKVEELWHSKLPLKIKTFYNLGRKKWKGSKMC
jgi:hypothetical protein